MQRSPGVESPQRHRGGIDLVQMQAWQASGQDSATSTHLHKPVGYGSVQMHVSQHSLADELRR